MNRQRLFIFSLVGIMVFSVVASGLLILTQENASNSTSETANSDNNQELACQTSISALNNSGKPEGEWPPKVTEQINELKIIDIREGNGKVAELGDCITVHYRLALADGTPVEGNDTFGGAPISFELTPGSLIQGWIEGIPGMKEGGFRRLLIPAEKAYGDADIGTIPPNSDLIFDVELIKIENK